MYSSERQQSNLVRPQQNIIFKQVKDTLQHQAIDVDKFHKLYLQLRDQPLIQQESENLSLKTGPFTSTQLFVLKSQVLAYKHLTRNQSIPSGILANALQPSLWFSEREKLTTKANTFYKDRIQRDIQLRNMIVGKFQIKRDEITENNYLTRKMHEIIDDRVQQLHEILQKSNQLTSDARLRLEIESKFLSLKDLYFNSREKVVDSLLKNNSARILETQLLERSVFRPERPARNRDNGNRGDNKLENQMKNDYQRRKRMKHKQFIQQLYIHHGKFFEFHKKNDKTLRKRVTQVKAFYQNLQNKKKQNQAKQQGIGLQMLKKQEMGLYIQYIKETKNKKIQNLLNQTNNFLKQLGAKVLLQKGQNPNPTEDAQLQNKQDDLQNSFANANKTYYNLTHTITQEITMQPTILTGGELKHYQLIGLQWLVSLYNNSLNGILADEMGLGKTIQTISLFAYLIQFKKNNGPFLIIVPLSTISNWVNEFDKWAPSIKKIVYKGSQQARNQLAKVLKATKWNVCITTYQFILRDRKNLNKHDWQYIVIDEGHRMKNTKSKFAQTLSQDYHSVHRLLLTGTPLQNNLGELWALLNFLLPKVFSDNEDFQKWFAMPVTSKNSPESDNALLTQQQKLLIINRLHQVLRPFLLRRIKKQVESQLPDKIEHVIKVQLSEWQRILYNSISSKGAGDLAMGSNKITTKAVMNLMMQLRKCCNHPYLFFNNIDDIIEHDYIFRCSGKFELLDRMIPKLLRFKHRILIFSQMTQLMNILQMYFHYKGYTHLRLDGNTKAQDREQITKDFNAPNSPYDILLLSTRAGGLGLNLQTADTVIIFDSDWNPQMDKQAEDRAHRIGQKKQVLVLRFITNTPIQELILQKAAYKMNLDELFIQGGLYNLKSSEAERKQKIEGLLKKRDEQEVGDDEIPNDDTINRFLTRSQQQYEQFTKMDEERYRQESKTYTNFSDPKQGKDSSFNYRLLGKNQVPQWLVQTQKPAQQQVKQLGKGGRQRKKVNYNDDISDQQFMKLLEQEYENSHSNPAPSKQKKAGVQAAAAESQHKSMD